MESPNSQICRKTTKNTTRFFAGILFFRDSGTSVSLVQSASGLQLRLHRSSSAAPRSSVVTYGWLVLFFAAPQKTCLAFPVGFPS